LPSALPLPQVHALLAPPEWAALDFISDLHLSHQTPLSFTAWQHYLAHTQADAVFILGDLVEAWIGDDARHTGFEARLAQALTGAARLRPTYLMVGNRDFLIGPELLQACGVQPLADPTTIRAFGRQGLFIHGDQLCLVDTAYQEFRKLVRAPQWQQNFLGQALTTRRQIAEKMRAESAAQQTKNSTESLLWADIDADTAVQWLSQTQSSFLVHGHTHRPATEALSAQHTRYVLSDWDVDHAAPPRAEVLRWSASGLVRMEVEQAAPHCGLS
jgi:UDP-2,3-diacylglucosamine hydrolase